MADLKNTEINDNLELPSGTTSERPASPQEGQIRYNTDLETVEFYNGTTWRPLSDTHPEATGGTVVDTDIGGVPYRIHYFTETGTDTLTVTNPGEVEYLIVAGGGAGGARSSSFASGGGGAGGLLTGVTTVTPQAYTITVGQGGNGVTNTRGGNGENSSVFGVSAVGGGGGGRSSIDSGGDGGSGGGAGSGSSSGRGSGSGIEGQGNDGGDSSIGRTGAGGGGAGAAGENTSQGGVATKGGVGVASGITGTVTFYAGGGGGNATDTQGAGGLGGGGAGARGNGVSGSSNTGGGGGAGGYSSGTSGNGGSGIVIIRYPRNSSLDSQPGRTTIATQPQNFQTVRDGLVLELDAGNPVSYPGSGSTWRDLSGIANNGNLENGVSYDSVNSGVLVFDGSNQYVGMGRSYIDSGEIGTGDVSYTLEAWFKLEREVNWGTGTLDGPSIIGSASSRGIGFQLNQNGDDAFVNFGARRNNNFDSSSTIDPYRWYHVVCTREVEENNRIYINGELDQTFSISNLDVDSTDNEMQIGYADGRLDNVYFQGKIAVARLYNTFLTDEQVLQNFNAERGRYGI